MIFYKIDLDVRAEMRDPSFMNKLVLDLDKDRNENPYEKFLEKVNSLLDNKLNKENLVIQTYQLKDPVLSLVCGCNVERDVNYTIMNALESSLKDVVLKSIRVDEMKEITAQAFVNLMNLAEISSGYEIKGRRRHRSWIEDFDIDYLREDAYVAKEYVFDKLTDKVEVFSEAKKIMADNSLLDELKYIYSVENCRQFYGVPVHYKIVASSRKSALKIVEVLVNALSQVNRLLGNRVNYISNYDLDDMIDEDALRSMFEKAQGATTVVELFDGKEEETNLSLRDNELWKYLGKNILKFKKKSLIIFMEILGETHNAKKVINKFAEKLDIVEIREGVGDKKDVEAFLMNLLQQSEYKSFVDRTEIQKILENETVYNLSTAYKIYDHWNENVLKDKVYPAYKPLVDNFVKADFKAKHKNNSLEELGKLVGLAPVKQVVKQILATCAMQKTRNKLGLKTESFSRHMLFTGNPGAAKTTVARLLSGIFATEGITANAKFVECGRSDLVGQYVGWTAPAVKEKFKEARGGVLFIDEAYSLVEAHNSFGNEAINTIVQEMENHRDDVIVVFAGYPDKMKAFLDKNEGLRSRIAFHVNFPDYSPEELADILKLMAKNKSYALDDEVLEKCKEIFASVCKHPEFGNGRFVRNMLEQAIMKQSLRIYETYGNKKVSKKEVCTLKAEDFDESIAVPFKEMQDGCRKYIGFMG